MKRIWRIGRIVTGFVLLFLGVLGLFLPFLQGIAMIVAGLLLLAPDFPWARRLLDWLKRKYKSARKTADTSGGAGQ